MLRHGTVGRVVALCRGVQSRLFQLNAFYIDIVVGKVLLFFQRIAERFHTGAGQLQDIVGGGRIVAEALQVVFHRGDGVSEGVHAAPVRLGLVRLQQLFFDELHTLAQNQGRFAQLDHVQATAHGVQAFGDHL